ncbi:Cysteine-rich RLK (RECEPTOR-like protein kinase) 8 [Theobroma cacao]|uniref:Cysteine-rich RLK (RECEPTOR-like protein kinase) 8 n=1 Tax=Theobroma cacao TaxID=3641 RepID=A0A061EJR6_THECC|nr:Cysteine-rich RLK (RECEPTOR-like protein kinase) 8 [Theobroma cacao]
MAKFVPEKKSMVVADVILVMTKITKHKLNGSNYLDWSKTVRVYLRSIDKDDHITNDPPTDNTRQTWMREDAWLFLQIRNSINSEIISLINHCEFVKELMDYLDFLYSGLPSELETVKSQILSGSEISSLHDTFTRVLHTESSNFTLAQTNNSALSYMIQNGILHQSSCIDTPSQNGVAERKNGHFLEVTRAFLFQMKVPKQFWADAVSTACFLINRMPSCVLHVTKLDPKSLKCVFLGYSRLQKGYRCYSPTLNRYLVSADITFLENSPFFSSSSSYDSQGKEDDLLVYTSIPDDQRLRPHALYQSLRRQIQSLVILILVFISLLLFAKFVCCILGFCSIPKTVHETLSHPGWRAAIVEEMMALDGNGTWDSVDLLAGKKVIGCKWVFAVKVNPDGSMARLKARLVAKGYAQTYGVDYSNTFSPVAKLTSVRLFISMVATCDWPLHQLDIKNAFLHGDLQEEVYMEQSPRFVAQGEYGKVCHLRKSLYGLKQSPRAWFGKFNEAVQEFGMKKSKCDHLVFCRHSEVGIILLIVYVDDIVITGSDTAGISSLKSFLHTQFQTKDLGLLKYFLGVEVTKSKKGISLSQRKYVLDLLTETRKLGAKPCNAPMTPICNLQKKMVNCLKTLKNADWAGSKSDRRSTTKYCVFIGGNLVSWKSTKQNVVSRSSVESEYRAMAQTLWEVVWMYQLLSEVGLKSSLPAKLWCDNQAALHIASNPVFHKRTKHIEIDCHFVREKIQQKFISTGYVKTEDQLGDIFTKALNEPRVDYIRSKLGMINIYAPA